MTVTDGEEQGLLTAVGSRHEKWCLHPPVPVDGVLPCHVVSLLSDERSYFESGVLLEAERLCCSVSSALRPGSLPSPSPGLAPTWSGSAGTCRLGWASGREGSRALPSGTQRPAGLDSGQALPCAPGLDNWGVCLRPQAPGFTVLVSGSCLASAA